MLFELPEICLAALTPWRSALLLQFPCTLEPEPSTLHLPSLQLAIQLSAWLIASIWLWKAISAAIGIRSLPNLLSPAFDQTISAEDHITIIVPARNEQSAVRACIESLLAQDYPNLHILAIDDRSTDQTGSVLADLAARNPHRLTALPILDLPPGWLGKTHAMALAARHAIALHQPTWLLFTDADILFHPQAIRRSLVAARAEHADHFVALPTPIIKSTGEAMLLGFFQVMGFWAVRLWRVRDPGSKRDSVGVGAFSLIRTSAYQQVGGFDGLRLEILEDLAFGRRVKLLGLRQRAALAPGLVKVHWAPGARGIVEVLTKNLFALFRFYISLLLAACCSILLFGVGPLVALAFPGTRLPGLLAILAIASMYRLVHRVSGNSLSSFWLFPFAAILLTYSLLRSMVITLRQGGVIWRGTFYPLAELRKHTNPRW